MQYCTVRLRPLTLHHHWEIAALVTLISVRYAKLSLIAASPDPPANVVSCSCRLVRTLRLPLAPRERQENCLWTENPMWKYSLFFFFTTMIDFTCTEKSVMMSH